MKNAVPKNASYFAVQAILDIYHAQEADGTTYRALRHLMKLFSKKNFLLLIVRNYLKFSL
ncbi:hypothetical protein N9D42_03340 [Candidatus Thioglobus sp.]|nr:hypothetical protein [Candidatus Thioglobus sp.]